MANLKAKKDASERKISRLETKIKLDKIKSRSDWLGECKTIAQKYARLRDRLDGCISCDKPASWHGQWHGSHFRPAGNNKAVALNLINIHKACSECNRIKSGNLINYQDKLIVKIGLDRVNWLKTQSQPYTHSIEYLRRYKKVVGEKCRRLEKRIKNDQY